MYGKTAAGRREVADRPLSLLAIQRRALILVDGRRGSLELAQVLDTPDAGEVLERLEQAGLVECATKENTEPPQAPPPPELNPGVITEVKMMMPQSLRQYLVALWA